VEVGNLQRIAYDWWCDSKHKLGSSNDQIIHVYAQWLVVCDGVVFFFATCKSKYIKLYVDSKDEIAHLLPLIFFLT